MISPKEPQKRFFIEAIEKAAQEQGIKTEWSFGNWVCRLQKDGTKHFIYGYNFPLNSASNLEIIKDKAATSYFLEKAKIPTARHELFLKPELHSFLPKDQSVESIFKFAESLTYPLVCKDNRGAGGNLVFKVENESELKTALDEVWQNSRGASLSPYYDVENEYRFFVLDSEIKFGYKKMKAIHEWKFNLNRGGEAELINSDDFPEVKKIISDTVSEFNVRVCSVDVIKIKNENKFLVLEVNTGITTEYFSKTSLEAKTLSELLYSSILKKMFEGK